LLLFYLQLYVVHPPEASHIVDAVRAAGQRLRGQALLFSAPLKTSLKDSPLVSTFEIDVTDAERVHVAGAHTTTVRKYRCALKDAKAPTADELVACGRSIIDNTAERIYSSGKEKG